MKNTIICKHGNKFEIESFSDKFSNIDCCGFTIEPTDDSHESFSRKFWFIYSLNNLECRRDRIIIFDMWFYNEKEKEFGYIAIHKLKEKIKIEEDLNTAQKQFDYLSKIYDNLIFY